MMLQAVFRIVAAVVSVYTFLCFVRIILTWIPSLSYSSVTRILAQLCDPYLKIFRGIRWLVLGSFDFSPAVGLCLLSVASTLLTNFSHMGRFTIGTLCAMIIELAWSIAASILTFLMILLVVRLILLIFSKTPYGNPLLDQIDSSISPLVHNIAKTFTGRRRVSYQAELITSAVALFIIQMAGSIVFSYVAGALNHLPF